MINILLNISDAKKDPNIEYVTGHCPGFCVLCYDIQSGKKCLFVSSFEVGQYTGLRTFAFEHDKFRKKLLKYFGIRTLEKIGVNKSNISINEMKLVRKLTKAKCIDVSKEFSKKRLFKSSQEIEQIAKACRITDKIFSELILQGFKTEIQVVKFIKKRAIDLGVQLSFEPVVATGKNAAKPHHEAGDARLNGFTVIDMGVKYNGYCSDMTRTVYFGKPTVKEKKEYEQLLLVQNQAIKLLKEGVLFRDVDAYARKKIGKHLIHGLGHGVGIEVHEMPLLSPKSKDKLQNGMVFTIEPGVYINGKFGIRIEDTIAFSRGKVKILTKTSKNLIIR